MTSTSLDKEAQSAFKKSSKLRAENLYRQSLQPRHEEVKPDVHPPTHVTELARGYLAIRHSDDFFRVYPACTSWNRHGIGSKRPTTNGPKSLFSTEALALKALLYELELENIERMVEVWRMLQEAEGNG